VAYWQVSDDRFWDISEQVKIEKLESKMQDFSRRDYLDVKLEAIVSLHDRWKENDVRLESAYKLDEDEIREKERLMLTLLDVIQVSILRDSNLI
jgi:hypothetical protein